jgi:hypothetical protein
MYIESLKCRAYFRLNNDNSEDKKMKVTLMSSLEVRLCKLDQNTPGVTVLNQVFDNLNKSQSEQIELIFIIIRKGLDLFMKGKFNTENYLRLENFLKQQ